MTKKRALSTNFGLHHFFWFKSPSSLMLLQLLIGVRSGWWSLLLTCSWLDLFFNVGDDCIEARNYCPLCLTALHFWILFLGKSILVHHIIAKASRSAWRSSTLRTKWEYRGGVGERGWNKHQRSILWEVGCHKWPFCSLYTTRQFWPGTCLILLRSWWGTATKHCCMGCFCLLKKVIHRVFFLAMFSYFPMVSNDKHLKGMLPAAFAVCNSVFLRKPAGTRGEVPLSERSENKTGCTCHTDLAGLRSPPR